MFEKKDIDFEKVNISEESFIFGSDFVVIVQPYLTLEDKIALMGEYISTIFSLEGDLGYRFMIAEYALIAQIIDSNTNINVTEGFHIDKVIYTKLWDKIREKIVGYDELRVNIDKAIELYQRQLLVEKSVGTIVENVAGKAMGLLDQISKMDVSQIKQASDQFVEKMDELNKNFPGVAGQPAPAPVVKKTRGRKKAE